MMDKLGTSCHSKGERTSITIYKARYTCIKQMCGWPVRQPLQAVYRAVQAEAVRNATLCALCSNQYRDMKPCLRLIKI